MDGWMLPRLCSYNYFDRFSRESAYLSVHALVDMGAESALLALTAFGEVTDFCGPSIRYKVQSYLMH